MPSVSDSHLELPGFVVSGRRWKAEARLGIVRVDVLRVAGPATETTDVESVDMNIMARHVKQTQNQVRRMFFAEAAHSHVIGRCKQHTRVHPHSLL